MTRRNKAQTLVLKGQQLQAQGDVEAAIAAYTEAIEVDPNYFDAAYHLARGWESVQTWTRAADAFRLSVSLDPEHSESAVALAECLRQSSCLIEAVEAYDAAITMKPDDHFALAGRGEALRLMERNQAALRDFETAIAAEPQHSFAIRGKAATLQALGRYVESVDAWERVLALAPDSVFAQAQRDLAGAAAKAGFKAPTLTPPPRIPEGAERAYQWGAALANDGRRAEALSFLKTATEADPTYSAAFFVSGIVLEEGHKWDAAIGAYSKALETDPDHDEAAASIGHAMRKAGRLEQALAAYEDALALSDDNLSALTGHGETLRLLHRNDEAVTDFDRVLEVLPDHLGALRGKAAALNGLGRYEHALPLWKRVAIADPESASAARALKRCELEIGRTSGARGRTGVRGVARIHFDLGKSMLQQERFKEAIASLTQASSIRKDWAEPWYYMGVAHERAENFDAALKAFDAALDRDGSHVEAACRKGDVLRRLKQYREGVAAYEQALEIRADEVRAVAGRAEALRMLGEVELALAGFDAALALDPDDFVSLCGKAAVLNSKKAYDDARKIWMRAREIKPGSVFVLKGLAQCDLAVRNGLDRLLDDITRESVPAPPATTPDDRQAVARQSACDELDRGRSYHKERQYGAAIACFKRALDLDPTFAEAALRLGMAYEDDRQFRRAIAAYETCLEIEPDHFQAATNIGEAYRKNEQYHEAIEAYDRALSIKKDYLYALAGRAECMRMLGKYEASLEWFDRALKVGASHAFAIQGKAAALNALQRFAEALPYWERALDIEPQSQFALDGKAYCEAQLRRADVERPAPEVEMESSTPTLDEQGRDLTALARAGQLPRIIGRKAEIRSCMKTLVRRLKANPILLGDPGVGKTAVVEGVAQRLADGDAPERLKNLRIIELSMGTLVAGTKYRGTFEERLREIIKEATSVPGIVLFIDEIHTLVGAGRTEGGSLDAANILKPALARGELTVIGATTMAEFRQHFESDSALERRFQPIMIDEPSHDDCVELLGKIKDKYEEHHGVVVDRGAIAACVTMSVRFIQDRFLPDKALDLLDESCAEASLSGLASVDEQVVAKVVSERTGIPVTKLTEAERSRMANIANTLRSRVVGQDAAVEHLANSVRLTKAGLRDPNRPRGVFLFRGGSGVGKTELAKALSDFLFPEGEALIRLDMSEYSDKFTGSRLLGAPPGYSGHGEEGQLSGPLRRRPYSVVLLDEFEKAHPDVQAMFLPLLDEGIITDSEGRSINARESFFILTTNAGTELHGKSKMGFGQTVVDARGVALEMLKPYFRPELLNRIDEVISFGDLGPESLRHIVGMKMEKLRGRAAERGITITWDDDVIDAVATSRSSTGQGARPAIRAIDELVGEPLGQLLLDQPAGARTVFHARVKDGTIAFEYDISKGAQTDQV